MGDKPKHTPFFFVPVSQAEATWQPRADVYRTSGGWLLKFELAGVTPEDVSICVSGNRIKVSGMRRDFVMDEDRSYYCMEISYNRFERSVELPCDLTQAHLRMELRDGILLVRVKTEGK